MVLAPSIFSCWCIRWHSFGQCMFHQLECLCWNYQWTTVSMLIEVRSILSSQHGSIPPLHLSTLTWLVEVACLMDWVGTLGSAESSNSNLCSWVVCIVGCRYSCACLCLHAAAGAHCFSCPTLKSYSQSLMLFPCPATMTRTPQEKITRIRCLTLPYSMFPSTLHTVSILSLHGS